MSDDKLKPQNEERRPDDERFSSITVDDVRERLEDDEPEEKQQNTRGKPDDTRLGIEEDLIKVEQSPLDDFADLDEEQKSFNDPIEGLEKTDISDQVGIESDESDGEFMLEEKAGLHKLPDKPLDLEPEADAHEPKDSTDKIYALPDEAVSSTEREKLISSLQSKIPNIMKHREPEEDEMPVDPAPPESQKTKPLIKKRPEPQEPKTEIISPPSPVKADKNVAYAKGTRLHFPSGTKFNDGGEVNIDGYKFKIRHKPRDMKSIILAALLGLVFLLVVAVGIRQIASKPTSGKVVGLAINARTGEVLSDVQVTIDELGRSIYSDGNGLFIFDGLKSGDWSISASKPQYSNAAFGFSLAGSETRVLTFNLEPSTVALKNNEDDKKKEEEKKEQKKIAFGNLTVNTNFPDAKVIVDNKVLGSSNKTYSRLYPGKHKLVVMMEGYKEYSETITVRENGNTTVDITLEEIDAGYNPTEISYAEYLSMGDELASKGKWREAAGNYTLALAKNEDGHTYFKRATAYLKMDQADQAENDFFKAAALFTHQGHNGDAINCFDLILEHSPENTRALRGRGFAYLRTGKFDKSIDDLKEAVDIDDKSYDNQIALGEAYYAMGKHKDALKHLKKARKIEDSRARTYALMALASLGKGDEKDAHKYFKGFEIRADAQDRAEFEGDPEWQRLAQMVSEK